jgi:DNA-binding HxlR family transcriptional regulator
MGKSMKKIEKRSDCPLSFSLDVLGDKWSLLIIRDLLMVGKFSFGEFIASKEKIASNILADRLSVLESTGIVSKQVSPKNKSKFVYSLTQKGIDLLPVLIEFMKWGAKYNPGDTPAPPKKIIKRYQEDRQGLIKEYFENQKEQLKG